MTISYDYKSDILSRLIKMQIGEERPLIQDYEMKVEAIKIIVNWGLDIKNGFSVTFSNDMRKIRKDYYKPIL